MRYNLQYRVNIVYNITPILFATRVDERKQRRLLQARSPDLNLIESVWDGQRISQGLNKIYK